MKQEGSGAKWQVAIGVIFGILFIFSASLLGIGVRLRTDAASTKTMVGYVKQNCTLVDVQIVACPNSGGYTVVWKRKETGFSVLVDPFSLYPTREIAQLHTNDYPLVSGVNSTSTTECMCNPNYSDPFPVINCKFEDACMLNVPMVEYMQKVGTPYGYSSDALIAVGSLLLFCFLFGFIFLFIGNGLCNWCCCTCCRSTVNDDNKKEVFYVLESKEE